MALALVSIPGLARKAFGTTPYDIQSIDSPSGKYRVELRPRWDDAVAILGSSNQVLHSLPITNALEYGNWTGKYGEDFEISTAGIDWYLNSIAFIDTNDAAFVMRHRSGNYIVIDLASGQPRSIAKGEKADADLRIQEAALSMLDSEDPRVRETGCIHCGQLGLTQAIPRLNALLADTEFHGVSGGDYPEPVVFLYVRKAAVDALTALGQPARHVDYEFPEKQVMRYDDHLNRYVIDLPQENGIEQSVPEESPQDIGFPAP